jgi:hypothetical protein
MILQGKDFLKWGNLSEQRRGILSERYSALSGDYPWQYVA